MIWSIDQDTPQYDALNALYPDVDYNNASSTESNQCKTTGCGESCPSGWLDVADLTTPAGGPSCPKNNRASLCCPLVRREHLHLTSADDTASYRLPYRRTVSGQAEVEASAVDSVVWERRLLRSIPRDGLTGRHVRPEFRRSAATRGRTLRWTATRRAAEIRPRTILPATRS
jgi:hypothetical protein